MKGISIQNLYALGLLVLILTACNPGNYKPILRSRNDNVSDTLRTVRTINPKSPQYDVYRIQVNDMLAISNARLEQIENGGGQNGGGGNGNQGNNQGGSSASGFRVEEDGTVNLPVVGKVYVMDLTRKEAQDKIQGLYKASVLKDPIISVTLSDQKVTLLGEFTQQGAFLLPRENTSLIEVVGLAGGFTQRADIKTLKIIRGDKKSPEVIYVNLQNLASLASSKIVLQNRDIVYVEPDKRYSNYEKSQSGFGLFQSIFLVISTGLLIFTSFFK